MMHPIGEELCQYIWQQQCFDTASCQTTDGKKLTILRPGVRNPHDGPDFLEASLRIGDVLWKGSIEVHAQASAWYQHAHQHSPLYEAVILHVVWEADQPVCWMDGSPIPTLELRGRVPVALLERYRRWMESSLPIPCARQCMSVPEPVRQGMLEKALLLRLQAHYERIGHTLALCHGEVPAALYILMTSAFGFHANGFAFSQLAERVPWTLIQRYRSELLSLEALLLGQAGLLPEASAEEGYIQALQGIYERMRSQHSLRQGLARTVWRYAGVRPPNFPCLRIAQLATILHRYPDLGHLLLSTPLPGLQAALALPPSPYWQSHYDFGKSCKRAYGGLGVDGVDHLVVNLIAPWLVTQGRRMGEKEQIEQGLELLRQVRGEDNQVTRLWQALGWKMSNGLESQGSLSLYRHYCLQKRCLACDIGKELLGSGLSAPLSAEAEQ